MDFLANITTYIKIIQFNPITDILDIAGVTIALFFLIRLIRGTRAVQLIKGLIAVAVILIVTNALNLKTLNWILSSLLSSWIIALIVLFQPELRLVIEQIGRGRLWRDSFIMPSTHDSTQNIKIVNIITEAAKKLSAKKVGALIAIERQVGLSDIISTGQPIGGDISSELLDTIFYPGTAMHDGGVVVRGNKIAAAMCLFPLTGKYQKDTSYGTRHRAGIGLSEITDAVIVIVSEETGRISISVEGNIVSDISPDELKKRLLAELQKSSSADNNKGTLKRIFGSHKHEQTKEDK